jgi:hypothetical protein
MCDLVRFEPPRIEFNLEPDAPGGLVQEISTRLEELDRAALDCGPVPRRRCNPPTRRTAGRGGTRARHAAILRDPVVAAIMETLSRRDGDRRGACGRIAALPTVNDA